MSAVYLIITFSVIVAGAVYSLRGLRGSSSVSSQRMNLPEESQVAFLVCTFSMLGKLAAVDGDVAASERHKVEDYIDNNLKLNAKHKALALQLFNQAVESPLSFRDYVLKFRRTYTIDRVRLCDQIITVLLEVSAADGMLSEKEEEMIHTAAMLLGLTEAGYQRLRRQSVISEAIIH